VTRSNSQPQAPAAIRADDRRRIGRPPKTIARSDVAAAIASQFAAGGIDAVSIVRTATDLGVSRATLYRTVPTKRHLLAILFEQMTEDLWSGAVAAADMDRSPGERLRALIRVHVDAAVRMQHYLMVFSTADCLPPADHARWRRWSRDYERLWVGTVTSAIDGHVLPPGDPVVMTRLILGMCIWVSRWHRDDGRGPDEIADAAIRLLGLEGR
jgi:AcrR family transcriptional regulator